MTSEQAESRAFGDGFVLTLITADPEVAARADAAGIDCVGLDFETRGKRARQPFPGAWISNHRRDQIAPVRAALSRAKLFVRADPFHDGSGEQVERLIGEGADVVMLPMFETADEVARFRDLVAGRAEISLLLETPAAMARVRDIAAVEGIAEINAGLNDLRLGFRLKSHFEILPSELFAAVASVVNASGARFGFGTLGRLTDEDLPVPPDLIYAQYPRLGARSARLFRHFLGPDPLSLDFDAEVARIRGRLTWWAERPAAERDAAAEALRALFRSW